MASSPSSLVHCPHSADCAGCPGIALDLGTQLERKRARVMAALTRYSSLSGLEVPPVVGAEAPTGYRIRAKLVVDGNRIGLYAQSGHRVVDIPDCQVLGAEPVRVAAALRALFPLEIPVLAVDLRATPEGVLVTLVVPEAAQRTAIQKAAAFVQSQIAGIAGVATSTRSKDSPVVLGRNLRLETGISLVKEVTHPDLPYTYTAHGVFTQAHPGQAARIRGEIVQAVVGAAAPSGAVLELHSGAGALSLALASRGLRVTAVESYGRSVELLERAAKEQSLVVESLAEDALRATRRLRQIDRHFEAVVVNPPRTGLAEPLRRELSLLAPKAIVYASCCPETLSRDLAHLRVLGYAVQSLTPFDMIPLSADVELLALLCPSPLPTPEVIYEDDALIAVVKQPHEPTTPQGEHAASLLARVRLMPGAELAVPVHRLDVGTSGVCLFARTAEMAHLLAEELTLGQKEYLALVRGITRPKGRVARSLQISGVMKDAQSRYRRHSVVGGHSLLLVWPDQGRKHQIRRHLAGIGHPVLGDERYGDPASNRHLELRHGLDRTFLHCRSIELQRAGNPLRLEAPMAGDGEAVLASLRSGSQSEG